METGKPPRMEETNGAERSPASRRKGRKVRPRSGELLQGQGGDLDLVSHRGSTDYCLTTSVHGAPGVDGLAALVAAVQLSDEAHEVYGERHVDTADGFQQRP